ncbi:MAG: FAD-dependent oxidoreductase [Gammaproteobacteria bacterium]|nr:FAD-dependent oxidoreductase [Gammaproteobacteria bacterium]
MKRGIFLLALSVLVAAFFVTGLDERLSLRALQSSLSTLTALHARAPLFFGLEFAAIYVLVTALSLPGAALLTLLAGALFGLAWGALIASFASSVGALLAFLTSRHLLRDFVRARFAARCTLVGAGLARDGDRYLFSLRLVPVIPFFAINLLMGLTRMPARRFYWISQLAMLPATLVYVNAGTQLARLRSLSDVFAPGFLTASVLLATLPWTSKAVAGWWRRRTLYARWQRPRRFDRNLVVIGAGAAGLVCSYVAAAARAKVTLVEAHEMGGDCLNRGCVPSKALIRAAKLAHEVREAGRFGVGTPGDGVVVSMPDVMAHVHAAVRSIAPHDAVERYTLLGVDVRLGRARVVDPWTIEVTAHDGIRSTLTTRAIVLATGARPIVPDLPGLESATYATSDTLWTHLSAAATLPRRIVILGGGPIGSELAQAFARLGAAVTLVESGVRILAREDVDVSMLAREVLQAEGVEVLTGHTALRCERTSGEDDRTERLIVDQAGTTRARPFDLLICAVGRSARLTGYGLEALGIPTGKVIETNEYLETLYPNIFAAGDIAGPYQFTHYAAHQAWYATVNALFGGVGRFKLDNRIVPWITFLDPEVARVGLNEADCVREGIPHEVTRYELSDLDRAIVDGGARGFVKVLTVPGKGRMLGVTIVGSHAAEMLSEFVLAMRWGLGLEKILSTIHVYPTFGEANKHAAATWRRAHLPKRALAWLARYNAWRRGAEA